MVARICYDLRRIGTYLEPSARNQMAGARRIGLREVRALGPGEEVWDSMVPGFIARRQKGAAVTYVLMYRTQDGRRRRYTIGRHGAPWTPDSARDEALRLLG